MLVQVSKLNIFLLIVVFTLLFKILVEKEEKLNVEQQKIDSFSTYVENNPENERIQKFLNIDINKISNKDAKLSVFQLLAFPLQNLCRILKRVGGHWHVGGPDQHQGVDGDKFFCLDKFNKEEKCVVYSFGLAADWTFEDQMVKFGCEIFAYDHTISAPSKRGDLINFFKLGLGKGENLKTLTQHLEDNNHKDTRIDFLKIDIEESEWSEGGFNDWIDSGALKNVQQLAVELHVDHYEEDTKQYINMLEIFQNLHRLGFRVISYEPNYVKGPGPDGIYNFVEIVLMKEK